MANTETSIQKHVDVKMSKRVPLKLNGLPIGWANVEHDPEKGIYYIVEAVIEEEVFAAKLFEGINDRFSIVKDELDE